MNKGLLKNLAREYQLLWEASKSGKLDNELTKLLASRVKDAKVVSMENDPLIDKMSQFGNEGAWGNLKLKELAKLIYEGKGPDNVRLGDWISVEIECIFKSTDAENEFVKIIRKNGFTKFITLKDDGSIHPEEGRSDNSCECSAEDLDENDGDCRGDCRPEQREIGKEIVVTFLYGDWEILNMVCRTLNRLKSRVNKTCGLHVHFDCRHISARQVTTLGKKVARVIPALKQILPRSRQSNRFCADPINTHNRGERYSFVNLHSFRKHKTLEIRGHSGTTDPVKIANWIKIIKTVMTHRNKAEILTIDQMLNTFNFTPDLAQYITKRAEKFATAKRSDDDVADDNIPTSGESVASDEFTITLPDNMQINVAAMAANAMAITGDLVVYPRIRDRLTDEEIPF